MKCLYCDKKISDKAKYCSEAHRKAYQRRTQAGQTPDKNDPDTQPGQVKGLTRTDAMFETSKPSYYKFTDEVHSEKCLQCGKEFKTSLNLLRHCSPQHMLDTLNSLTV